MIGTEQSFNVRIAILKLLSWSRDFGVKCGTCLLMVILASLEKGISLAFNKKMKQKMWKEDQSTS